MEALGPVAAVDRARVKATALWHFGALWMRIFAAESDMVVGALYNGHGQEAGRREERVQSRVTPEGVLKLDRRPLGVTRLHEISTSRQHPYLYKPL